MKRPATVFLIFAITAFFTMTAVCLGENERMAVRAEERPRPEARDIHREASDRHEYRYDSMGRSQDVLALDHETGERTDAEGLREALDPSGESGNSGSGEGAIDAAGGGEADIAGTGGVALLEYAKDQTESTTSNISSTEDEEEKMKKSAERKIGGS